MKCLRLLSSDETETDFYNNLNENLTIEPNSKIGLVNMSIELDDKNIIVTDDNKSFTFKVTTTAPAKPVILRIGSYNYNSFINEISYQMNRSCILDDEKGLAWMPILEDNKVSIQIHRVNLQEPKILLYQII